MKGVLEKKFFNDRYEITCAIPPECNDVRLDLFVQLHFPSFSREFIKKKIERDQVKILTRQGIAKPSSKLKPWDQVYIVCYRENIEDVYWDGEKILLEEQIEMLYANDQFCVINKPPFMCAHPTGRHVFYCATVYAERSLGGLCSTVHRLDRETSGILVLSRTSEYGNLLATQFEQHLVQKFYFFISLKNKVNVFPFIAKERLGEHPDPAIRSRIFVHCFSPSSDQGKSAQTYFDVIYEDEQYICGLAIPKTGRQHQIRAHAAHHGFPLIGDKIYYKDHHIFQKFKDGLATKADHEMMMLPRHALHAASLLFKELALTHKHFFAPLPQDLKNFISSKIKIDPQKIEKLLLQKINDYLIAVKNEVRP